METIRIHRLLDSETIPELKPLIGQNVEIIVRPTTEPVVIPGTPTDPEERWKVVREALDGLKNYDFDAWREQRDFDMRWLEEEWRRAAEVAR